MARMLFTQCEMAKILTLIDAIYWRAGMKMEYSQIGTSSPSISVQRTMV